MTALLRARRPDVFLIGLLRSVDFAGVHSSLIEEDWMERGKQQGTGITAKEAGGQGRRRRANGK